MATLRLAFVVVSCIAGNALAYSGGAPEGACSNMRPSHGVAPQTGQAPYSVTSNSNGVSPGDTVQVTVSGSSGFRGFFIRAKQGNSFLSGQFGQQAGTIQRCSGTGITHSNPNVKQQVTVTWTAPANLNSADGPVTFVATVVQTRAVLWVQIPSLGIAVGSGSSGNAPSGTGPSPTGTTSTGTPSSGTMTPAPGNPPPPSNGQMNPNNNDDDDDDDKDGAVGTQVGLGVFIPLVILLLNLY